MIWAISGVLALAGLVLLAVAALRLLGGLRDLKPGLDRVQGRVGEAKDLQERLEATLADAQRIAETVPRK